MKKNKKEIRPWGEMKILKRGENWWIKIIKIKAGGRLSLQSHKHRSEVWVYVKGELVAQIGKKKRRLRQGDTAYIKKGTLHRLFSQKGGAIIEIAFGDKVSEEDIIRYEDDYGRS